jgi:hypothetical protein
MISAKRRSKKTRKAFDRVSPPPVGAGARMSLNRWNARRDQNEPDIVKALEKVGAEVIRLGKFDLLVLYKDKLFMLDAKTTQGRTTKAQDALIKRGWPLRLVVDEIAALKAIGAIR